LGTEVKGKPHKLIFHNSEAQFTPLATSNKDMEWLEGQKWYFHAIFAAYGLSPQEVGFYENSNRSTGESQERVSVKNAIKPYLNLSLIRLTERLYQRLLVTIKLSFNLVLKMTQLKRLNTTRLCRNLQLT
jgi:phage portal protein BeeE